MISTCRKSCPNKDEKGNIGEQLVPDNHIAKVICSDLRVAIAHGITMGAEPCLLESVDRHRFGNVLYRKGAANLRKRPLILQPLATVEHTRCWNCKMALSNVAMFVGDEHGWEVLLKRLVSTTDQ
jgi:hypothetical protein